jgi:cysteine synthase B
MSIALLKRSINLPQSNSIESSIGNTPLFRLRNLTRDLPAGIEVLAKAEYLNPGGSVKDRAALWMILEGERSGKLLPGMTILDATSGNTGIAYGMLGPRGAIR